MTTTRSCAANAHMSPGTRNSYYRTRSLAPVTVIKAQSDLVAVAVVELSARGVPELLCPGVPLQRRDAAQRRRARRWTALPAGRRLRGWGRNGLGGLRHCLRALLLP